MDDGGFEVDVEDAEHINGVKSDADDDEPFLLRLEPFSSDA